MRELWDILDANGNKTGRFQERGKPMLKGEYHLVVHIWIINSKGEFLISKRAPSVTGWANMWQTTGGSAVAGDDSLATALKETREETGIVLKTENGELFKRYSKLHSDDNGGTFYDVWLFRQEADINDVVFQPEETCGAMWASKEKIVELTDNGKFIANEAYPYIKELFDFCI